MRRPNDRPGFSLLEVLVALGIMSVLLIPIMDMLITSNRAAAAARRQLDTALYAQSLLELLSDLKPEELPQVERVNLASPGAAAALAAIPGRWRELGADLNRQPPFSMLDRYIQFKPVGGKMEISIVVEWYAVPGDEKTKQRMVLSELCIPREL